MMEENLITILDEDVNAQEADRGIEVLRGVSGLPGGVASLLSQLTRTMKCGKASLVDIATVQKSICEQFGICIPDCFMESMPKKQNADNSRSVLEQIVYGIYCRSGEKEWISAGEMKQKYPELKNYSTKLIGRTAKSLGIPSKCVHGYTRYLIPVPIKYEEEGLE